MTRVTFGKSRVRESRKPGSVRVAPCKRMKFGRLKWRPRQSLTSSRVPSLAWCPVPACRQARQAAPGNDLLSGIYAVLHAESEGQLPGWDAHREISATAQPHVPARTDAANTALVDPGAGQQSQRRAEGPLCLLRHRRELPFLVKGPSGGRTLLAQDALQPKLGWPDHVGRVPPDQAAAADTATKAAYPLSGVASSCSAVNHLSKSVVRETRTLRSVGTGGGRPPPVTRPKPNGRATRPPPGAREKGGTSAGKHNRFRPTAKKMLHIDA